jgi:23S rRNA (cytidine1920-2'-O)/16S rRNA (cytidine1409-2'-O)-methyltransferase
MRVDVYLHAAGYTPSRKKAQDLISHGAVFIDGKEVKKSSENIDETVAHEVKIEQVFKYVSRGGMKLEAALDAFGINVSGKSAVDIGASTGGFTDCLLQRGAKHVIAVDSGFGQMIERLRLDDRVTVIENYNARFMQGEDLEYSPSLCVMDVSFISATYIIPAVASVLADGGAFVCLIKPQFEVGRSGLGKGGIVKNDRLRKEAVDRVTECAVSEGLSLMGVVRSPIEGGDGNIEYLAYFRKGTMCKL